MKRTLISVLAAMLMNWPVGADAQKQQVKRKELVEEIKEKQKRIKELQDESSERKQEKAKGRGKTKTQAKKHRMAPSSKAPKSR